MNSRLLTRFGTGASRGALALIQASFLASIVMVTPFAVATVVAANPSANLDQCANDPAPSPHTNGCSGAAGETGWVNGNLGASKSTYLEGDSIPYRLTFDNLSTTGTHTVTIQWDTTKSSKHAIDYLTTWNRTVADSDPCLGVTACGAATTFPIPVDPQVSGGGVTPVAGNFTFFGATISSVSAYTYPDGAGFSGDKTAQITITFTAAVANPVLAWGGHIATRADWGANNSAVAIPGSPYHMRLIDLDGAGGNQDRSLSEGAVIFPASITIIKDASPNGSTSFPFTATPAPLSGFSLVDDGTSANTKVFSTITTFTDYTITETPIPAGWAFDSYSCSVTSANGGSTADSGATGVAIALKEGENWTCMFLNHAQVRTLSITKTDDLNPGTYNHVGQVITYTITATNTGNVSQSITVNDDPALDDFSCAPANGSAVAVGASIVCTGTHTVTQADLDAGSFGDNACANATGATEVCADDTVNGSQNPDLTITKDATETGFSAVGDVINYSITATNSGNVTLTNVTVTDPNVSNLICTPSNPVASLAPGGTITCTASHTITQGDIDTGFFNNQACVDDGVGGAASICADVTTPGSKNPALTITKVATETGFSVVGDVIHYTITATNSGNMTLTGVTVTDPNVSNLDCTPATPVASLAPGDSITCTASHTIVQVDLDAGSFFNQACVDDGAGGAASVCDDVTTPGTQGAALGITKVATETGFSAVGNVIHYTIKATNIGNVTLTNVVVTDPNVSDLACVPALPVASLAPGDSITCTASHIIVAADITAAHFFNEACVDDGDGPAAEVCDDVTTPFHGGGGGGETTQPTQPPTDTELGTGSGPSDNTWFLALALGLLLASLVVVSPTRIRRRR